MNRPASKPLPSDQEEFEAVLVSLISARNPDIADALLRQWYSSERVERWGSGVGFLTTVIVPQSAPAMPLIGSRELSTYDLLVDVGVPMDEEIAVIHDFSHETSRKEQAFAELHHDGVRITMLECASFAMNGAVWPEGRYSYSILSETGLQ